MTDGHTCEIVIVGSGRLGLPVAAYFGAAGARVTCADRDETLVACINSGCNPFPEEDGLVTNLRSLVEAGRLDATTDTAAAVAKAAVVLVLVRLTTTDAGEPDYGSVDAATEAIGRGLKPGTLVVYETTLPAGDTRNRFAARLEGLTGLRVGTDFHVAFSPERVTVGRVFRDLDAYPKIVGGVTPQCGDAAARFYRGHLTAPVMLVAAAEAAEMTKLAETIYRDVNIALANELALHADAIGVDITEVIAAANSQPYSHLHQPGVGVGGHCIPVYPHFFLARASETDVVRAARVRNAEMPGRLVRRLATMLGGLDGRQVAVLGLAYRPNVSEVGDSVALVLIDELRAAGASVRVHDPLIDPSDSQHPDVPPFTLGDPWAEGIILQAAHTAYQSLSPTDVPGARALVDGRNLLDPAPWIAAGVTFAGVGRRVG